MRECNCRNEDGVNDYELVVVENRALTPRLFWLSFEAPELARRAKAGRAVMIFPNGERDPLLGRPFALSDADAKEGRISVCYVVAGRGTNMISKVKEGEKLRVRAFLGKELPQAQDGLSLAGGGVGAASLILKKRRLNEGGRGKLARLFVGIPGRGYEAFAEKILSIAEDAEIFTDDGTFGRGRSMFDVLPRGLSGQSQVWCCGPLGFLDAARRFYESELSRLYYILDKRMACGYGGCMGCAVRTADGLKRVCVDRSLFRADEVNIHDC